MKTAPLKNKLTLLSACAASIMACSALAQDTATPRTEKPDSARHHLASTRGDRLNGAAKASDLIGMTVKNNQDEKLGKVEDLAVDVESGRIVQVILSVGGFLGLGDTLTAVPPGVLHHDVAQKVLHLDADKEKLKAAPKFELSKWAECCDSNHLSAVYRHYGEEPAFRFVATDGSLNTVSKRNADGSWERNRLSSESQSVIPAARLSQVQKASKLLGMPVKNLQDEKLGKVENLLVDLLSGRVVAAIVSSGGFLGMGDELSAVPPTALRFNPDRDRLQLDASKEMLSHAPHFKAHEWPDFSQPGYASEVYRAYKVEPYFSTDATTDADNTQRNVRDRDDRTVTPLNQGNSKADVDTTAQIRKEILAGKNLSVNARNVKIITNNGRVTLRGPVNTAEEKRLIGEIAKRMAPAGTVDNQLEIKSSAPGTY